MAALPLVPRYNFVFNLFLEKILQNVETTSLYECRMVNKYWRTCADPVLLQRNDNVISFSYSPAHNTFVSCKKSTSGSNVQSQKQEEADKNLDLAAFLGEFADPSDSNLKLPPSRRFRFTGPIFNTANFFSDFVSIYSPIIQGLALDWDRDGRTNDRDFPPEAFSATEVIWTNVIANGRWLRLEQLIVKNFRIFGFGRFRDFEDFKLNYPAQTLPALKFIEIEMDHTSNYLFNEIDDLLPDLIASAPILKEVHYSKYFYGLQARKILLEKPALFRLESVIFRLFNELEGFFGEEEPFKILEYTEKYCCKNKGLIHLDLQGSREPPATPAIFENNVATLMKLISRSRNSLKHHALGSAALPLFMKIAKAVGIPAFPGIKSFRFSCGPFFDLTHILNKYPILFQQLLKEPWESPGHSRFSILFPEVEDLTFTDVCEGPVFEMFFPVLENQGVVSKLTKVKSLHVHLAEEARIMGKILKVVPFVRQVDLGSMLDFPQISRSLWQLEHVETCRLHISLAMMMEVQTPAHFFPFIDCAFTGLPEKLLLTAKCVDDEILQVDEPRRNPCILNLRELKQLILVFDYRGGNEDFENYFSGFLTETSFKYGFAMMKNLSVTIKSFDAILDQMLRPFSSLENVSVQLTL